MNFEELIARRVTESVETKQNLLDSQMNAIGEAAQLLVAAYASGKKSLWFGNGGSAADAQHIAAELVGNYYLERKALPALALPTDPSSVTAIANDLGFDRIFARQVEAFGQQGDVAVGITTSGRSANVIEGLRTAAALGLTTIVLCGSSPPDLAIDCVIPVPSSDTPRVQECHALVGHILCEIVEASI